MADETHLQRGPSSEPPVYAPKASATMIEAKAPAGHWRRAWDSDVAYSFRRSPVAMVAALITVIFLMGALLAPWIAPQNPFDPGSLNLMNGFTPPLTDNAFTGENFLLGTDDQGRDIFSTILYGSRISLLVGFSSVIFALILGTLLGLLAGYLGGWLDSLIMRIADVQLSFPAILIALLIFGVAKAVLPREIQNDVAIYVLIVAIGLSNWVQYARTVRGTTMVEKNKEYVHAARLIGLHPFKIMLRHVLPNVIGPVLVIATIGLALAIITEATLSYLGVGTSPTEPSLGKLIQDGQDFLFSGEWWITLFPGLALVLLALSINLLGDWLRDALNPKLR